MHVMPMISLAAGTVPELSGEQLPLLAAAAGYDATGLRLDPLAVTTRAADRLRTCASDAGVSVLDVEVVRLGPRADMSHHLALVELAARVDASFLLVVSEHTDPLVTAADVAVLCGAATGSRLRIALEFMAFTAVRTPGDAVNVLELAGMSNAVVLVDALHLQRCGGSAGELIDVAPERLGYLQLCDAPAVAPSGDGALAFEARHSRLPPGEGELPLTELLRIVPDQLPISVEVQSDMLQAAMSPQRRAEHLLASTRATLAEALLQHPTGTKEDECRQRS